MEKELSIFTRFLKENNLISVLKKNNIKFIFSCYNTINSNSAKKLKYNYFDTNFTWVNQKEGYFFWKLIQLKYCLMLLNVYSEDKEYCKKLDDYIDDLSNGYNNYGHEKTNKDKIYIKYINDLISKM